MFRHLYGYWQDYQAIASNLSPQEITAELDKMKRRMKERRKVLLVMHVHFSVGFILPYVQKKFLSAHLTS